MTLRKAAKVRIGEAARRIAEFARTASHVEYAFVLSVIAGSLALRVFRLGQVPRIITGDELDNLQTAYHIIEGTGPGPFGFDWKPGPALSLYPLAWTVQVFGDNVWSFRLFPVLLSLGTLVGFYLLARDALRPAAALGGMVLLSTNLWFLHFSRTAWDNLNAALFAVGACWATSRAISGRGWHWWTASGCFSALGMYGYFTGRLIIVAVLVQVMLAVVLRKLPLASAMRGIALTASVSGVLVLPFARNAIEHWDYFNRRTQIVSVFNTREPYEGDTDGWVIAAKNVVRNYRGFVLQDGSEFRRGLWARYGPPGKAPLDLVTGHLFWVGLILGVVRFRRSYSWWPYAIPVAVAEVFSRGSPDLARGVLFAPFYFLFVGLSIDELCARVGTWRRVALLPVAAGTLVVIISIGAWNVREYFRWQSQTGTQMHRLPGIDVCEWDLWRTMAREAARAGPGNVNPAEFERQRRELDCSAIVRALWTTSTQP
ncbi:MAG TPA: glycosyltransferase family 39 protein [Dehalococcoidia bacterium]|nr:glycosyltransferase family 39 protein [Dehalococcoidia bacterium]